MRELLVRGLSEDFRIPGDWCESPLAFLRTEPDELPPDGLSARPLIDIRVEAHDGRFRCILPSGRMVSGSLRWIAIQIHEFLLNRAVSRLEGELAFAGVILRDPAGNRIALTGGPGSGKSWLALALMREAWDFESDSFFILRPEGAIAHPSKLHLYGTLEMMPAGWREILSLCPVLTIHSGQELRCVDPRLARPRWEIRRGALQAIFVLSLNPGGRGGLLPLRPASTFERLSRIARGKPSSHALGPVFAMATRAPSFALSIGCLQSAVANVQRALDLCQHHEPDRSFGVRRQIF